MECPVLIAFLLNIFRTICLPTSSDIVSIQIVYTQTSIQITSYLGTNSGGSRGKPDEVKMVLYSRGVWNAVLIAFLLKDI